MKFAERGAFHGINRRPSCDYLPMPAFLHSLTIEKAIFVSVGVLETGSCPLRHN